MELFDDLHFEWFEILKVKPEDYSVKPYGMLDLFDIYFERLDELDKHMDRVYNKLSECTYCKKTWNHVARFFEEKRATAYKASF
jgi:hypothetical protein